ncbi:MAG: ABC transporter permease [Betaproteobacteria bacterium]|nr:ABC transporter permease [Betaproteobacteria bacterium]
MSTQANPLPRRRLPAIRDIVPYVLVAPAVILVGALLVSLWTLLGTSVFDNDHNNVGLANYVSVLTTPSYYGHFLLSAKLAGLATLGSVILGYPVAYYMQAAAPKVRRTVMLILVLIFFSDYSIRLFGLILALGTNGIFNRTMLALGLTESPVRFMYSELGVVIGLISGGLPFMIFAISGVLDQIDRNQLQAAELLGASPRIVFLTVTLPLSASGIVAGSVIVFLLTVNSFITPALLGGGYVRMAASFIYEQGINLFNIPLAATAATIVFLSAIVLLAMVNWLFDRYGHRFGVA